MAEPESRVPFQQAGIGIEKREEFAQLQAALEAVDLPLRENFRKLYRYY